MSLHVVHAAGAPVQQWRNGGGRTRELLNWKGADGGWMRLSLADVEHEGPFSSFPGVTRWFAVVAGAGVVLEFAGGSSHRLVVGSAPLRFDGLPAPHCRLLGGSSVDLNLMLSDAEGEMRAIEAGVPWSAAFMVRGLFVATKGMCHAEGLSIDVTERTLIWTDVASPDPTPWTFVPERAIDRPLGWWLGCTPVANGQ